LERAYDEQQGRILHANAAQPPAFVSLVPLMFLSCGIAYLAYRLAKEKGRHIGLWTVLGLIPIVNFCCMFYFAGASNLKVEAKLDEVLRHIASKENGQQLSV
jgi:hypothetical protein